MGTDEKLFIGTINVDDEILNRALKRMELCFRDTLDGINIEQMQPDEIEYLNQYHETVYQKIAPHLNEEECEWLRLATASI